MDADLSAPRAQTEWASLLADVRAYQQRIGFAPTLNFRRADAAIHAYALCGHGSPHYLPYSYEDPAIRWLDVKTEEECRAGAENRDVTFAPTEALAGLGTPVTGKMLVAPLARFLYLVIHEDCHEQFALPGGIEEALCNALAYEGMAEFARERYNDWPVEYRAISEFVSSGTARAEFTVALYEELSAVYARREGGLISEEALLQERGEVFRRAEQRLGRAPGTLNNVWLATVITYSRHYRLMQRVIAAFDGDLAQAVAYFRRLDSFAARLGCGGRKDVVFVRAYERTIVAAMERALETGNFLGDSEAAARMGESALRARCDTPPAPKK